MSNVSNNEVFSMSGLPCNMTMNDWSVPAWKHFHNIFFTYNDQYAKEDTMYTKGYIDFIDAFAATLPCFKCKTHFILLLAEDQSYKKFKTRDEFVKWSVDIHNKVNAKTGKPPISYVEAYTEVCKIGKNSDENNKSVTLSASASASTTASNSDSMNTTLVGIVVFVLLILLVSYVIYYKRNEQF